MEDETEQVWTQCELPQDGVFILRQRWEVHRLHQAYADRGLPPPTSDPGAAVRVIDSSGSVPEQELIKSLNEEGKTVWLMLIVIVGEDSGAKGWAKVEGNSPGAPMERRAIDLRPKEPTT